MSSDGILYFLCEATRILTLGVPICLNPFIPAVIVRQRCLPSSETASFNNIFIRNTRRPAAARICTVLSL